MTLPKPPCKDCPDRHRACHDDCERFKVFRALLEEIKRAQLKDRKQFEDLSAKRYWQHKPQY